MPKAMPASTVSSMKRQRPSPRVPAAAALESGAHLEPVIKKRRVSDADIVHCEFGSCFKVRPSKNTCTHNMCRHHCGYIQSITLNAVCSLSSHQIHPSLLPPSTQILPVVIDEAVSSSLCSSSDSALPSSDTLPALSLSNSSTPSHSVDDFFDSTASDRHTTPGISSADNPGLLPPHHFYTLSIPPGVDPWDEDIPQILGNVTEPGPDADRWYHDLSPELREHMVFDDDGRLIPFTLSFDSTPERYRC